MTFLIFSNINILNRKTLLMERPPNNNTWEEAASPLVRGASLIRSLPPKNFPSWRERNPIDPPLMEWRNVRRGASLIWCLSTMRWKEASKAHTLRGIKFNSWLPTTWRERDIVAPLIWGEETLPLINPPHLERGSCLPHLVRGKCLPHLKVPPSLIKVMKWLPSTSPMILLTHT